MNNHFIPFMLRGHGQTVAHCQRTAETISYCLLSREHAEDTIEKLFADGELAGIKLCLQEEPV